MDFRALVFGVFLTAALSSAEAGAPRLVHDVNAEPVPQDSNPVYAGSLNGKQLFWTSPGLFNSTFTASRLWSTDGTAGGTRLLLDLRDPTIAIPDIPAFAPILRAGNRAFFSIAATPQHVGTWVTDGSAEGTRPLTIPMRPSGGGNGGEVSRSTGDKVIFATPDLWISDGHTAGTKRLTTLSPSEMMQGVLAVVGSKVYFLTSSNCCGQKFWVVPDDGSAAPAQLNGPAINTFREVIRAGNRLFLIASDQITSNEVWAIDTLNDSIVPVADIPGGAVSATPAPWAAAIGDDIVFAAEIPGSGSELWRTDGTAVGTVLVKDIWPGGLSSITSNTQFLPLNGRIVFVASDGTSANQIWSTDGTSAGTVRLAAPPFNFNTAGPLFHVGNRAYFPLGNGNTPELWVTDGTPAGTRRVASIPGANPFASGVLGDDTSVFVYETQDQGGGASTRTNALWHYDPATDQAVLLKSFTGNASTSPAFLNGRLYFSVTDAAGHEPWVSDGTVAGTRMLKDIEAQTTASSSPDELVALGSEVFFVANDGVTGRELWKSDGTSAGTRQLADLLSGPGYSSPAKLTAFNGALYFFAQDNSFARRFWSIRPDGTSLTSLASLVAPTDKPPYFQTRCEESFAVALGGTLYFSASSQLNKTDGTVAGTLPVSVETTNSNPCGLTTLGSRFYFSADGAGAGRELWSSDGTAAGTGLVTDILAGSAGSSPGGLVTIGQTLFFAATDAGGPRIFRSDGTAAGTVPLDSVPHAEPWLSVSRLTPVGTNLFFLVEVDAAPNVPAVTQYQLWRTDGTAAGTTQVDDVVATQRNAVRGIGGRLYFASSSAAAGIEPWIADSSSAHLLADLNASGDSDPPWFADFSNSALFEARNANGVAGLWRSSALLQAPRFLGDIGASPVSFLYRPNSVVAGGKFFFVSESDSVGSELHVVENERPTAAADNANATSGVDSTITVDGNDSDPDGAVDPATVRITTPPASGVASVVNGRIVYRSTAGFTGTDTLSYTIDDDQGQTSAPAAVTVTVAAAPAPPAPPPPGSGGSGGGGGTTDLLILLALAAALTSHCLAANWRPNAKLRRIRGSRARSSDG